ncbi:hypothetical protein OCU04_007245 [Sclerotinia nivalis]|uniref:Alcohol dehydrogenase n=1 Tax=Sclerotinia nivalis TaxID=352851 RepID=A0A9X0ALF0_9HELO|nr:hypothetical protein OCU04_007245 [Sclerotinia nivalis]
MGRTGGRYACLEEFHISWQTRRAVKVKVVMGFELLGVGVDLGHTVYSRTANLGLRIWGRVWVEEMQALLDTERITTQPIWELENGFEGIVRGLHILQAGKAQGQKLVVRIPW